MDVGERLTIGIETWSLSLNWVSVVEFAILNCRCRAEVLLESETVADKVEYSNCPIRNSREDSVLIPPRPED